MTAAQLIVTNGSLRARRQACGSRARPAPCRCRAGRARAPAAARGATCSILVITVAHRRRVADDLPAPLRGLAQPLVGRAQLAVLVLEALAIARVREDALDLLDRDLELVLEVRVLGDEVDRAGLDRGDRVVDRAVAGQDDDRQVGRAARGSRGRSRARRCGRCRDRDRGRSARGRRRCSPSQAIASSPSSKPTTLAAARAEHVAEQPAHLGLIVDADDGVAGHRSRLRPRSTVRRRQRREAAEVGRQHDRDRRAAALLGVDDDAAVVRRDHALGDREADARAGLLGREAGHEEPRQVGARGCPGRGRGSRPRRPARRRRRPTRARRAPRPGGPALAGAPARRRRSTTTLSSASRRSVRSPRRSGSARAGSLKRSAGRSSAAGRRPRPRRRAG